MSREIKFRAWDTITKDWLDVDEYTIYPDDGSVAEVSNYEIVDTNHDAIIEQYTGLKDKNGVEIYEGDIVMWRDGENTRHAQVTINPDIKFLTCDYVFRYGRFAYKDTENHLTVIGNIHENP